MDDNLLEKLGNVFVKLKLREKYGITFARYVEAYNLGTHMEYHVW